MQRPEDAGASSGEKRYKGVRRRKWGKWVSEIRVPGTTQRLWLGSYATPEAAAMAHDTAVVLLRGQPSSESLNFPDRAPAIACRAGEVSPSSVQRVASNSGMAVDAELIAKLPESGQEIPGAAEASGTDRLGWADGGGSFGDISIDDYM